MILSHYYQIYCKFSSQCKFYWALFSLTEIMAGGSRALEEMHLPKPTSVHTRWHSGLMESKPCTALCLWMSWVLCSMSRSSSELKGPPPLGSTAADSPQFLALCCLASTGGVLPLPRQRSVTQLCPTLCHPMDHSPPSSSAHGIFQARILEWVAISSSLPRQTTSLLHVWVIRQVNHSLTQDNSEGPCQLLTPFGMLTPSLNYFTAEILHLLNPASSPPLPSPPLFSPPLSFPPLPFSLLPSPPLPFPPLPFPSFSFPSRSFSSFPILSTTGSAESTSQ